MENPYGCRITGRRGSSETKAWRLAVGGMAPPVASRVHGIAG
jgi:hypothetical protein